VPLQYQSQYVQVHGEQNSDQHWPPDGQSPTRLGQVTPLLKHVPPLHAQPTSLQNGLTAYADFAVVPASAPKNARAPMNFPPLLSSSRRAMRSPSNWIELGSP
jgi:hypothetical protein